MFQTPEGRAGVSSPLISDDADYLGFFTRIVERLEGGVEKVRQLVEEKSHDLLARAASRVFSHLVRFDLDVHSEAVTAPMPKVIRGALEDWVEDHVDDLIAEFAPAGGGSQPEVEGREADGGGGDNTSP